MSHQPLRGSNSIKIDSYAETFQTILDVSSNEEELRRYIKSTIKAMKKDASTPLKWKKLPRDKDGKLIIPKITDGNSKKV